MKTIKLIKKINQMRRKAKSKRTQEMIEKMRQDRHLAFV